jgi:hypothetical protein
MTVTNSPGSTHLLGPIYGIGVTHYHLSISIIIVKVLRELLYTTLLVSFKPHLLLYKPEI